MIARGKARIVLALVAALVATAATVLLPYVLGQLTDVVFAGAIGSRLPSGVSLDQVVDAYRAGGDDLTANLVARSGAVPGHGVDWPELWTRTGQGFGLIAAILAARSASGLLLNAFVQDTVRRIRTALERTVHRLPMSTVDGGRRGHILNTTTVDVDNLATAIGPVFVQLPVIVATIVFVLVALGLVSPFFLGVAVASVPLVVIASVLVLRRARPHMQRQWSTTSDLTAHIEDVYSARDMLAAYSAHDGPARNFDRLNTRLAHATRAGQTWSGSLSPIMTVCNALVFIAIAVFGAVKMLDGAVTLGALQAVVMYASQLSNQVSSLASTLPRLQSGLVSYGRVREFLAQPAESAPAIDDPPPTSSGRHSRPPRIVFDDVSFSYDADRPVLDGVDFVVEPGQTVAIVGASGSGKTTITSLMQRFYDPDAGSITVDGSDIAGWTRTEARAQLAVVAQEPWLFSGTVGENIDFGGDARSDVIDEIVAVLPGGRGTRVSGDHDTLSAGEKQLVAVARALAARPRILILDEATSAADPRSELLIQRGVSELRRRTTSVVVTHRRSTLALADRILVLGGGRIVESGTLDELTASGREFARLQGMPL
ncbi:ABC transporter ATP-binding protein/permease [Gordonia sp. HY285]|uniref:ABC transporter ATP-binding protein n=1 Tax=Gordonia liuliyuniae TaxID=2911517 RepID=UPI001F363878|nr:ABC transporter ATP-binding protein [Gordonia liuliyuniae]MCF8608562.1 ABC transporter ATP-binding protein/permease [Gordonia liuliyuniae]